MLLEKLFQNRFLLRGLMGLFALLLTSIVHAYAISCNTQSQLMMDTPNGQISVTTEWGGITLQGHELPVVRHSLLGYQQGQIDLYDDGIIEVHYHHCQQLSVSLSTIEQFIIELPQDNWVLESYSGETLDTQLRAAHQTTTLFNLPDDALIINAKGGQLTLNALNAYQTHLQLNATKQAPLKVNIEAALGFEQLTLQANSLYVNAPITSRGPIELHTEAIGDNPAELMIKAALTAPAVQLDSAATLWVDSSINTIGAQGGWIQLQAPEIHVLNGAQLEASGDNGGGSIVIGDPQLATRYVVIEPQAEIRSDALLQGDGGHIIIDSQQATIVQGYLSAQGGYLGGDGGFVETSSQGAVLTVTTAPQLSAVAGQDGTWLLDPYNIEIVAGATIDNVDIGSGVFTATADNAQIGVDLIRNAFFTAKTVIIETAADGTQAGDIIWNAPFDFNGIQRSDAELILKAANDIIFNAGIIDSVADTEALNLELIANVDNANGGAVRLNPGVTIETAGGNFSAQGQGQLDNKNGITLDDCLINAAGGNITLTGSGYSGGNDNNGIQIINGGIVETTQAGAITLEGQAGVGNNGNHGIVISDANTQLKTENGSIRLQGHGKGQGRNNHGILLTGGGLISSVQGDIFLEGSGGETQSQGIVLEDLNADKTEGISTIGGDIELIGRSASGEVGLALGKGLIEQLEGGMITLTADEIDLGNISLSSPGELLLQPLTPSLGIAIGGNSNDSRLNLLKTEFDRLADGFSNITIGRDNGQGTITLDGNLTVTDPMILRASGEQGAIATQNQQLKLRGQDNATIMLLAQQDIHIADINNPGRSITLDSAQGSVVAGKLQTRGLNDGGEINLHGYDIEVALIQSGATQGQGGAVNVTATHLFKITQGIGCALNTQCSIDSAGSGGGGFIRITHGGNGVVPFIVGDATINGTASSIYSGEAKITPKQFFLGEHVQPPNIQIISEASEINAQYQLTLNYSGEGHVETDPIGQPCGSHCQVYPAATQVNLIVTPAEQAEFSGWQEDTCKTNQLIMMADQTCTAVFTQLDPSSAEKPTPAPTDYAGVQSNPPPNSELKLGTSSLGVPTHARLHLIKQGNLPLIIESATLSGQYTDEFQLLEPQLPFTIADAHQPIAVRLACVPAAEGLRTATLMLTTNALQTPKVQYNLTCTGLVPARYASEPAIGETLNIGQQVVHKAIVQEITLYRSGEAALEIDLKAISGPDADDFKIIAPALPTTLEAEQTQQTLRIRCIPADVGLRQATLKLTTTDAQNSHPHYALTCTGLSATRPAYTSTPKPGSTLELGRIAVGDTASQKLTVDKVGEGSLEVDLVALSGEHADDFAIRAPEFPLTLAKSTPIIITCTPKVAGLRTAQLLLTTQAAKHSEISYTLVCEGYETITEVNYSSTPAPHSVLTFADTPVGMATPQDIVIQAQGSHELTLKQVSIEGEHEDDFSLPKPEFPVTLAAGESYSLTVHCKPSSAGMRRAQLSLATTAPMLPTVAYTLKCQATSLAQAGYDSIPAPGSTLALGQTELNQPTTYSLKITSVGAQPLQVLTSHISGQNADEFSIIKGQTPVTVDSSPHILTLQCTPQVAQKRQAQLTLTTNDPDRAQIHYPLTCFGHDEWAHAIILGQIQTETGQIGAELAVKALQAFKLTGFIAPARQHFDQLADIIVHYRWLPAEGSPLTLPVTLAQQQRLDAKKILEINIFEGNIIDLNGTFEVSLGYKLSSGEWISAEILTLEIQPNQPPTNILLSSNTVAAQSPADTIIGTFTTVDADKHEQFVYFLTEDAGGYFKVVGNELRTSAFPLNYAQGGQRHITVRSMDMANHTVTKDFLIHVTPVVTEPYQIQLTRQQVLEKSPEGTIVGKFFSPSDHSSHYIYELLDDAEGRFTLVKDLLLVLNGQHLDFERQKSHAITVRSQEAGSQQVQEKTFTIEVVNRVDVHIQEAIIRDKTGALLSAEAIEPHSDITIEVQLVADETHIGRQVEWLCAALYVQEGETTTFKQDKNGWHSWSGDLAELTALDTLKLQPQQQLTLFQGQLTQFAGGQLHIFAGYRLPSGEIIFQPNSFNIKINGLEK